MESIYQPRLRRMLALVAMVFGLLSLFLFFEGIFSLPASASDFISVWRQASGSNLFVIWIILEVCGKWCMYEGARVEDLKRIFAYMSIVISIISLIYWVRLSMFFFNGGVNPFTEEILSIGDQILFLIGAFLLPIVDVYNILYLFRSSPRKLLSFSA